MLAIFQAAMFLLKSCLHILFLAHFPSARYSHHSSFPSMEIISVDSLESQETPQNPVAKYYPYWDLIPGTSDFPLLYDTPVLVPYLLSVSDT